MYCWGMEGMVDIMSDINANDEKFMKEAIKQAMKADRIDEVPIGCVIVRDNNIIARGYNKRTTNKDALAHAEIIAIKKACKKLGDWRLEGCTLYVSVEPCQMCSGAIVQARIDRVVFGAFNKKAGCAGSVINMLDMKEFNHQVSITSGVMEKECGDIMSGFFKKMRMMKIKSNSSNIN